MSCAYDVCNQEYYALSPSYVIMYSYCVESKFNSGEAERLQWNLVNPDLLGPEFLSAI